MPCQDALPARGHKDKQDKQDKESKESKDDRRRRQKDERAKKEKEEGHKGKGKLVQETEPYTKVRRRDGEWEDGGPWRRLLLESKLY